MRDAAPEVLGTVYLRGELHAEFPTAKRTLCLIECSPHGELMTLRPTCKKCLAVVSAYRRLSVHGVPREWKIARKRNAA